MTDPVVVVYEPVTVVAVAAPGPQGPAGGGGGGGAVDSVNGQTGVVVLDAGDVGAVASPLAGADVAAAGAVMEADTSTSAMQFVVDEDNMASNSATKIPTQQSVKAYVDAVATGGAEVTELYDSDTEPVAPPATYLRFERDIDGDVQTIYLGTVD